MTKFKKIPEQIINKNSNHSIFYEDLIYSEPLLLNTLLDSLNKENRECFYVACISPEEIHKNTRNKNTIYSDEHYEMQNISAEEYNHYKPIIKIKNTNFDWNLMKKIKFDNKTQENILFDIFNAEIGSHSHTWLFDDIGDWVICNQRQDITLFSTSNKTLLDSILSSIDKIYFWIPKGYKLDPENPPPYLTKMEIEEGTVSETSKAFTLELLKNYQWKDWE